MNRAIPFKWRTDTDTLVSIKIKSPNIHGESCNSFHMENGYRYSWSLLKLNLLTFTVNCEILFEWRTYTDTVISIKLKSSEIFWITGSATLGTPVGPYARKRSQPHAKFPFRPRTGTRFSDFREPLFVGHWPDFRKIQRPVNAGIYRAVITDWSVRHGSYIPRVSLSR